MFKMPEKIVYALPEIIGNTDLFVGRKKEFDFFLGQWFLDLEKNFAQNQAIISRRKKGKTAFLQRLFNIFWSGCLTENKSITVIPFYHSIHDTTQSLGEFALDFFANFIKAYASYEKKDQSILERPIMFEQLGEYIPDQFLKDTYEVLKQYDQQKKYRLMWSVISKLPASVARVKKIKILQIIDEFQNINGFIYDEDGKKCDWMSGTYMQVAEFREAPMIVSGSEVHWLLRIVSSLTGRFQVYNLENLPEEEAKDAIERYAIFRNTKINEEAKENIWRLTEGDPLYIKALFLSRFRKQTDYTIKDNIVEVYEREIEKGGEIYWTWMEYMLKTFNSVNKINSKRIMLYLFNQGKERTRDQIKKDLNLPYTDEVLEEKLEALIGGDLISHGKSHFDYKITEDKTYDWVFRNMYQKEIEHFVPDISKEIKRAMGKENYMKGKYQEFLIKEKLKKPFKLNEITENGGKIIIHPEKIQERVFKKIGLKTYEIDLLITTKKPANMTIYIDIKNKKEKYGKRDADRWMTIASAIQKEESKVLFLTFSETGYTKGTKRKLIENGIFVIKD